MRHIFLDFDRTLFDTDKFYTELERKAMAAVSESSDINLNDFLYCDVIPFLKKAKKRGWKCYLITFGERGVQERKFLGCGIEKYFYKAFYVESGSKVSMIENALEHTVSHENIYFIDDTIEHLEAFRNILSEANAIKMSRPGAKGSEIKDSRFTTVANLNQAFDAIDG